jgi:hypothetical protein
VVGDSATRHDPMGVAPLGPGELTMPTANRVGRDEGRQTFSDRSQALENVSTLRSSGRNRGRGT